MDKYCIVRRAVLVLVIVAVFILVVVAAVILFKLSTFFSLVS